jgi:hypothetical protein
MDFKGGFDAGGIANDTSQGINYGRMKKIRRTSNAD